MVKRSSQKYVNEAHFLRQKERTANSLMASHLPAKLFSRNAHDQDERIGQSIQIKSSSRVILIAQDNRGIGNE